MDKKPYKTSNPALNEKVFEDSGQSGSLGAASNHGTSLSAGEPMTMGGTVTKSYFLVGLTVAACSVTWHYAYSATVGTEAIFPWVLGAMLIGFVVAMVIIFNPRISPALSPFYAIFEGLALGGISAHYESAYPGIVMQSVGLTLCVFLAMLLTFTSGLIKPTEKFRMGVVAATGGVALFYLVSIVLSFGFHMNVPLIHDSGLLGIGFSVFVVVLAALNLVLDFDFIQTGVTKKAPKYLEWYAAFGLLVTLVWLYIEVLRLVSKLRSR